MNTVTNPLDTILQENAEPNPGRILNQEDENSPANSGSQTSSESLPSDSSSSAADPPPEVPETESSSPSGDGNNATVEGTFDGDILAVGANNLVLGDRVEFTIDQGGLSISVEGILAPTQATGVNNVVYGEDVVLNLSEENFILPANRLSPPSETEETGANYSSGNGFVMSGSFGDDFLIAGVNNVVIGRQEIKFTLSGGGSASESEQDSQQIENSDPPTASEAVWSSTWDGTTAGGGVRIEGGGGNDTLLMGINSVLHGGDIDFTLGDSQVPLPDGISKDNPEGDQSDALLLPVTPDPDENTIVPLEESSTEEDNLTSTDADFSNLFDPFASLDGGFPPGSEGDEAGPPAWLSNGLAAGGVVLDGGEGDDNFFAGINSVQYGDNIEFTINGSGLPFGGDSSPDPAIFPDENENPFAGSNGGQASDTSDSNSGQASNPFSSSSSEGMADFFSGLSGESSDGEEVPPSWSNDDSAAGGVIFRGGYGNDNLFAGINNLMYGQGEVRFTLGGGESPVPQDNGNGSSDDSLPDAFSSQSPGSPNPSPGEGDSSSDTSEIPADQLDDLESPFGEENPPFWADNPSGGVIFSGSYGDDNFFAGINNLMRGQTVHFTLGGGQSQANGSFMSPEETEETEETASSSPEIPSFGGGVNQDLPIDSETFPVTEETPLYGEGHGGFLMSGGHGDDNFFSGINNLLWGEAEVVFTVGNSNPADAEETLASLVELAESTPLSSSPGNSSSSPEEESEEPSDPPDFDGVNGGFTMSGGYGDDRFFAGINNLLFGEKVLFTVESAPGQGNLPSFGGNSPTGGEETIPFDLFADLPLGENEDEGFLIDGSYGNDDVFLGINNLLLGDDGDSILFADGVTGQTGGGSSPFGGDSSLFDGEALEEFSPPGSQAGIDGGTGNNNIFAGIDTLLYGGRGDDLLFARGGNAASESGFLGGELLLHDDAGNNRVFAGESTLLYGGQGRDRLFAGDGGVTLAGGSEADQFWIASGNRPQAMTTIADFEVGVDVLGFAGMSEVTGVSTHDFVLGTTGVPEVTDFSALDLTNVDGDTLISIDDYKLALLEGVAVSELDASSFVFA